MTVQQLAHGHAYRTDLAPLPAKSMPLPLPGTVEFESVRGREGTLLVVQHASTENEIGGVKQTARDLGLGRIGRAAIRPDTPSVRGKIRKIREFVVVIDLNAIQYNQTSIFNENLQLEYQRTQFGSNTRPGELVRDPLGNYFSFESDRRGSLLNWSTEFSFLEFLTSASEFFPDHPIIRDRPESLLGIDLSSGENILDNDEDKDFEVEVVEVAGSTLEEFARERTDHVAFARVALRGIDLTWHSPFMRFDDMDHVAAEAGVYIQDPGLIKLVGEFARYSGPRQLLDDSESTVQMRENGHVRIIPV